MTTSIFAKSHQKAEAHRRVAQNLAIERRKFTSSDFGVYGGSGGSSIPSSASAGASILGRMGDDSSSETRATRQYAAFKDTVFTAIRPIAVKFSNQAVRVGYDGTREAVMEYRQKCYDTKQAFDLMEDRLDFVKVKQHAPKFIQKYIGKTVTPLEDHLFLRLLASPNEMLTQCGLMMLTAASFELTGRVAWWFDSTGSVREDTGTSERLWYIPWHWLKPIGPKENRYARFELKRPGMIEGVPIDGDDIFYAMNPNPADPAGSISTVQQIAKAIDTDERIQQAQHASMENAMRPNMIITAGRMPGMPGQKGPRAMLQREDRQKIIEAIKLHYQGVQKFGEPLILDAFIEDVKPYMTSPNELDLLNSSTITNRRIMQGIGVSPIVAGHSENANRAGSSTAHEIFYELVLNPLINLIGQALDSKVSKRYSGQGGRRLRIWIEEAKAHDADLLHMRFANCRDVFRVGEVREYVTTGEINLSEIDEATSQMFLPEFLAAQAPKPEASAGQGNAVNGGQETQQSQSGQG